MLKRIEIARKKHALMNERLIDLIKNTIYKEFYQIETQN